jgi:acetolactate synthase-1/2/3 large subunit
VLVRTLVEAGVDTFFGIPGGPVIPVFDAVLRHPQARLVESRHESSAAFAAMGYWRATKKVPAVVVTAGPGATNVVTGIAAAHLEGVPMIVICGDVAWAATGSRLAQDSGPEGLAIDQMLARITRAQIRLPQAKAAAPHAIAALDAATNPEKPGPALLVVPIHNTAVPAFSPGLSPRTPTAPRVARRPRSAPRSVPREEVLEATQRLASARRPLILIGAGCRAAAPAIRRLVDVLDVPFMTTPQAKGLVSEEHPRSLRHGGLAASWWAREYTKAGVDVCLALGTDMDDSSTSATPPVTKDGEVIHVDLDASVFNRNHPTSMAIVADVGDLARAMYEVVIEEGLRHGRGGELVRAARHRSPFDQPTFAVDSSERIAPHRAIADLERAAGPDARFVSDIGEHMLFALHYLTARGPDSFHIHLGLGSMGSGICSAVGLALGDRTRRVVCVCGDGGMQMAGMEALVARRERLPIVYAVFNDARYNMVFHGYRQLYGREAPWSTEQVDFAGWAESFGMRAARIERPGEITAALLDRGTEDGPMLLDIRIDPSIRIQGAGRVEALQHMSTTGVK